MRLRYWTRAFREVEFNPESGRARVVRLPKPRSDAELLFGYAAPERSLSGKRHWFALYRSGEAILFQTNSQRWHAADPAVEFLHTRRLPFVSRFEVRVDNSTVFSIRYSHFLRLLFALIDITYDKIDQDADFFLEFVAENANSQEWRDHVLERWPPAPAA